MNNSTMPFFSTGAVRKLVNIRVKNQKSLRISIMTFYTFYRTHIIGKKNMEKMNRFVLKQIL